MRKLLGILVLILLAGFIAACGDTQNEDEDTGGTEPDDGEMTDPEDEFTDGEEIDTGFEFSLDGDGQTFVYTVRNTGEEEETLSFNTGQRYEYEISQDGEVLHTFSEGRAFTQALEDITVQPGDEVTFDVEMPDLDPGEYTIKIFLVAADIGPASEIEETFTVEE